MRAKDLFINIEADLSRDEVHPDLGTQRRNLRQRFLPCQAGVDACIGAVYKGIKDTHLQHGRKDHSSTKAYKGKV